jgi:N-acetylneuraminate synthase
MIISTGMASVAEIDEAARAAQESGCRELVLLKCTSTYPASPQDSNVRTIPHMHQLFGCEIGLSDHTMGCGVAVAAVAFGATVIEKHFTLSRAEGGVDSVFSMEPAEFALLRQEVDRAWQALGDVRYGATSAEEKSKVFRRSLYVACDVKQGQVLTADNVRVVRPGFGLAPKHLEQVLGRRAKRDVEAGTPISWELLD